MRPITITTLLGPVQYSRGYYWGPCSHSLFPTDVEFGLFRQQTPAVQQVTTLAGIVQAFEGAAEKLLQKMTGLSLSESTVLRTTEDIGTELAQELQAGELVAPQTNWEWPQDHEGHRFACLSLDATGVRQQGPGAGKVEGRMVWVGEVFNSAPQAPEDTDASRSGITIRLHEAALDSSPPVRSPVRARYLAGLIDLDEAGRQLRRLADSVGFQNAEVVIGLTDGGTGLPECLETHCLSGLSAQTVLILDFYHLSEHLEEFGRAWIKDEALRQETVGKWCHCAKHEGGEALLKMLELLDLKGTPAAVRECFRKLKQYIGSNLYRMDYPRYVRAGWPIGSGNIESACKTVINQRLNGGGMRWGPRGTSAVSHLRAIFCSEPILWETLWKHRTQRKAA